MEQKRKNLQLTSNYIGICKSDWNDCSKKWVAKVRYKKEVLFNKLFMTELEAARARDRFIIYHEIPCRLNLVPALIERKKN